jgi:hypothetical protein
MSYAFSYYGAETLPSLEDTIDAIADGVFMSDAEVARIVGPVAATDLIGATVRGIGAYLRLVYRAEDFASIPEGLGDLVRRAA